MTLKGYGIFKALVESTTGIKLVSEYRFASPRRWRFDFACPDNMLAIEIEGGAWTHGRHTRGKGFIADMEKYNTATALGWRVLRFTPDKLLKTETIRLIEDVKKFNKNGVK